MAFIWYKKPTEEEWVGVDFGKRLGDSVSVQSAVATIYDKDGTDISSSMIVPDSLAITDEDGDGLDDAVAVQIKDGSKGEKYWLKIIATLSNDEKKQEDIIVKIREVSLA